MGFVPRSCFAFNVGLFFFFLSRHIRTPLRDFNTPTIHKLGLFVPLASLCWIVSCWIKVLQNSHEIHSENYTTDECQVFVRVLWSGPIFSISGNAFWLILLWVLSYVMYPTYTLMWYTALVIRFKLLEAVCHISIVMFLMKS